MGSDLLLKFISLIAGVRSSPKTKKCIASFLVPEDSLALDSISFGSSAIFLSGPSIDKKDAFSVFLLSGSEPVCAEELFI